LETCIEDSLAHVVFISAPPGVGKTRLRCEFTQRLTAQQTKIETLLGEGELMSAGSPYGLLARALRRLCGVHNGEALTVQRNKVTQRLGRHLDRVDSERILEFLGELCGIHFPIERSISLRVARNDSRVMSEQVQQAFVDWLGAECAHHPMLLILE